MRRLTAAAMILVLNCSMAVPQAAACVTSDRPVFFFEFPQGSSVLSAHAATSFRIDMHYQISGGKYVDAYDILASGDLGEGEQWTAASPESRAADRRLGESRAKAIAKMIASQPKEIRASTVRTTVRENRQVFTEEQLRSDPRLNERLRGGVAADVRERPKKRPKGAPVPVC